jgi:hypothetical protein
MYKYLLVGEKNIEIAEVDTSKLNFSSISKAITKDVKESKTFSELQRNLIEGLKSFNVKTPVIEDFDLTGQTIAIEWITDGKAMSLSEIENEVVKQWYEYVESKQGWIWKVLPDALILNGEGSYFMKVPYTKVGDKYVFGEPIKVEMDFKEPERESEEEAPAYEPTDNSLKTISMNDTELRVGNYLALFGGRDLEGIAHGKNADGSLGEYFTQKTIFESDFTTSVGRLPVDWEHGSVNDSVEPGRDEILGYVDWSTAKADANGLFVERVLNRRNKYISMLETLIAEGLIGTSSQAIPSKVSKAMDGAIEKWPLMRDTLTVNPMEPRMLGQNAISVIKSLADEVESFKKSCIEAGLFNDDADELLKLEVEIKKNLLNL